MVANDFEIPEETDKLMVRAMNMKIIKNLSKTAGFESWKIKKFT